MPVAACKGQFSKDSLNQILKEMGCLIVICSMCYSKAMCSALVKIYNLKFAGLREFERIMQEIMFCCN